MFFEKFILYFTICISIIAMWKFIPQEKRRHSHVAFLFKQFLTWFSGLVVANLGLIEYPVRFFQDANKASFTFEFMAFPVICAFFNIYYPEFETKAIKLRYYFSFCTVLTIIELIFENYTQLIKYIHWSGYLTWFSILVTLYISRLYYRWFFKSEFTQ